MKHARRDRKVKNISITEKFNISNELINLFDISIESGLGYIRKRGELLPQISSIDKTGEYQISLINITTKEPIKVAENIIANFPEELKMYVVIFIGKLKHNNKMYEAIIAIGAEQEGESGYVLGQAFKKNLLGRIVKVGDRRTLDQIEKFFKNLT